MNEMKSELYNNEQIKRTMKKTRNKMTLLIIRIFALCMGVVILFANAPNFLYYLQQSRINDAQKLSMLCYEFTTTDKISGYSVNYDNGFSFDRQIKLYYRDNVAGSSGFSGDFKDISLDYNLLKRKLLMYYPINGTFMHPDRFKNIEASYQQSLMEDNARAMKALEKNRDNSVTLLDLSFTKSYTMEEVMLLKAGLDLEINWFAIETGYEKLSPPSNMGMPKQQYYLWGFPSKLYTPENIFEPISLDPNNINDHLKSVLEELNWVDEHAYLFDKESMWFTDKDIYKHLNESGFQCYGIQVNGPTDQIYELIQRVEYQYINIQKMDLWYW